MKVKVAIHGGDKVRQRVQALNLQELVRYPRLNVTIYICDDATLAQLQAAGLAPQVLTNQQAKKYQRKYRTACERDPKWVARQEKLGEESFQDMKDGR
jgi:hypothetical protein